MASSTFSGDLGLVGLFDLGQLLMLNRATGCLTVTSEGRKGYLYFLDGQIVNAIDDVFDEGQGAACHVFAWRTGRFEFRPEPPGGATPIQIGTESLMLEAARLLDEAGQDGAAGAPGEALRLREKTEAAEALREAFSRLAREAREAPASDAGPALPSSLEALVEPDDRLLIRPGFPPRLRRQGAWRSVRDEPLTFEAFEAVKVRLLGVSPACQTSPDPAGAGGAGGAGAGPAGGPAETPAILRRVVLPAGQAVEFAFIPGRGGDALLLRPADLPPPDRAALSGPLDRFEEVLGQARGLVVVGGSDHPTRERLLASIVVALGDRPHETVLLVPGGAPWRHAEAAGTLIQVAPGNMAGAIEAVGPSRVVFTGWAPQPLHLLEALETVGLAVVSSIGSDPGVLVAGWLARLAGADPRRVGAALAGLPLALIAARPDSGGAPLPGFDAWLLSEEERDLALRGEAAALSRSLSGRA